MPRVIKKIPLLHVIKNYFFNIIAYFFSIPILIILIIIYPFRRIIITELETRSIGHMSASVEIFLSEIKLGFFNKKNTYLWFCNKKISNKFLYYKWRKKITIISRFLLKPSYVLINNLNYLKFLRSPFRHWKYGNPIYWQNVDIYNVLNKVKPNIKFSESEERVCRQFFQKNNLVKNNYICFVTRSNLYLKDNLSIRDSNINNLLDATVKFCNEKNLKGVKMGNKNNDTNCSYKNIIDFSSHLEKNELIEIYLLMNCKFIVSTGTGVDHVPILNRKKILFINYADINCISTSCNNFIPFMIPKKFAKIKNNKIISYKEVFEKKLCEQLYEEDLNKNGYKTIENNSTEIYGAICEMYDFIKYPRKEYPKNKLEYKFWQDFKKYYPPPIYKTSICNKFIELNKELF